MARMVHTVNEGMCIVLELGDIGTPCESERLYSTCG